MMKWNKYKSENVIQAQNLYFDYLTTQVLKESKDFLCYYLRITNTEQVIIDTFFPNCKNKRLHCHD